MKHAGTSTLETLKSLLVQLRQETVLIERKPGIFYVNFQAFLHFHEDSTGLFADLKVDGKWQRFTVTGEGEQETFLIKVRQTLSQIRPKQRGRNLV